MQEKTQIELAREEYSSKRKKYIKLYKLFLLIAALFIAFFFLIRFIIPDEKINGLFIFPVFILTILISIKNFRKMNNLKNDMRNILQKRLGKS